MKKPVDWRRCRGAARFLILTSVILTAIWAVNSRVQFINTYFAIDNGSLSIRWGNWAFWDRVLGCPHGWQFTRFDYGWNWLPSYYCQDSFPILINSYTGGGFQLVNASSQPVGQTPPSPAYQVTIPLLPWALLMGLKGMAGALLIWRAERKRRDHDCESCGYDLTGNISGICPECGERIRPGKWRMLAIREASTAARIGCK